MPVSCGRGESSLKMTRLPFTKNSTPKRPAPSGPAMRSVMAFAMRWAWRTSAGFMGHGIQLSR